MTGSHPRPKFVTAFAGRRDGYQVPLALAEAGRLEQLITSGYATPPVRLAGRVLPAPARAKLFARRCVGLPDGRVTAVWRAEAYEQFGRFLRLSPPRYWSKVNRTLSEAAGREATRTGADLLLYEPYAVEAFARRYVGRTPRKVLFHFHPHPDYETVILDADTRRTRFPFAWPTPDGGGNRDAHNLAVRQVWRRADLVLCASSVTKRSLVAAGASAALCRVVPYGVETADAVAEYAGGGRYRVLFVGSGIQRKGLHHLLTAWSLAALPAGAELTIVCRTIDPALAELARRTPGCVLLPGVSESKLRDLYRAADLFALPSLLEGFGLSYLEALAEGCPVLGTDATGVPDLGTEADGVFTVAAGDMTALAAAIERAAKSGGDLALRRRAWATARRYTWGRFRKQLLEELA